MMIIGCELLLLFVNHKSNKGPLASSYSSQKSRLGPNRTAQTEENIEHRYFKSFSNNGLDSILTYLKF